MTILHFGDADTLATILIANIADEDSGYVALNGYTRKMVFDDSVEYATDTTYHPYYIRPNDYGAGGLTGVWVEDVGAEQPEAWNAGQVITGKLDSTNLAAAAGSRYDLDNSFFQLGGTDVTWANIILDDGTAPPGIFQGLNSGAYKFNVGDGVTKYFRFDSSDFILKLTNLVIDSATQTIKLGTGNDIISLDAADATYRLAIGHATYASAPFRVTKAGVLTATGATISGTITATAGTIAGFTVNSTEGLYAGAGATRVQMKPGAGFWAGATAQGSAPFSVTQAGILSATEATLTGGVTITDGNRLNLQGIGYTTPGMIYWDADSSYYEFGIGVNGVIDALHIAPFYTTGTLPRLIIGGSSYFDHPIDGTDSTNWGYIEIRSNHGISIGYDSGGAYFSLGEWLGVYTITMNFGTYSLIADRGSKNALYPSGDEEFSLGTNTRYWKYIYAGTGIYMKDDSWIGLVFSTGKIYFNSTTTPDHIYFSDCNVGINSSAPDEKLVVDGKIKTINALSADTAHILLNSAIGSNYGVIGLKASSADVFIGTDTQQDTIVIDRSSTRVGIYTSTPETDLHVVGTTTLQGDTTIKKTSADINLRFQNAGSSYNSLLWWRQSDGTTNDFYIGQLSDGADLRLYTYGATLTALTVQRATGEVGINDTSPSYQFEVNGTSHVNGTFTATTKTFIIDHPVDPYNKILYHAVVEAPRHDLIYRGVARLTNGSVEVDLNADSGMSAGTFETLCQNAEVVSLQNQDGFDRAKPSKIQGGRFTITCENPNNSTDYISWVVMAERKDPFVIDSDQNDPQGRLIVEIDKVAPTTQELKALEKAYKKTDELDLIGTIEQERVDSLKQKKGYLLNPECRGETRPYKEVEYKANQKALEAKNGEI